RVEMHFHRRQTTRRDAQRGGSCLGENDDRNEKRNHTTLRDRGRFVTRSGADGIRTHDPLVANQVLSQLSYRPRTENRAGAPARVAELLGREQFVIQLIRRSPRATTRSSY